MGLESGVSQISAKHGLWLKIKTFFFAKDDIFDKKAFIYS